MILRTILACCVLLTSLASSTIVSAQTRRADLCGKWEQRCLVSGKWLSLGTFEVTLEGGVKLEMKLSEKTQFAGKLGPNGISNVDLTASVWTFDSDWGAAGTANFSLAQDELGRFVGYPYVNGNRRSLNLWVKLDSNPVLKQSSPEKKPSIVGNAWRSVYKYNSGQNVDVREYTFLADGSVTGKHRTVAGKFIDATSFVKGTWKIEGDVVFLRGTTTGETGSYKYTDSLTISNDFSSLVDNDQRYRTPYERASK